jgi:hypothetical protein
MTSPSGADGPGEPEPLEPDRSPRRPRVRRSVDPDQPAGRWAKPDGERDEIWGDEASADTSERLRRDVPPHHGG